MVSLVLGLEAEFWGHLAEDVSGLPQQDGDVLRAVVGRYLMEQ